MARKRWPSGVLAMCVFITASSPGQERVQSISDVLSRADLSGSISYWSPEKCRPEPFRFPAFPKLVPATYSGSPVDSLREMFAGDPKMVVNQEPNGHVRLVEQDVPTDMLDVKIHHVSFDAEVTGTDFFRGPIMAMWPVLLTREVQDYANEHDLGPILSRRVPGNAAEGRHAHGELNDVTVSQALDYLSHTFPGYWIYGNCLNADGKREVNFSFIENAP